MDEGGEAPDSNSGTDGGPPSPDSDTAEPEPGEDDGCGESHCDDDLSCCHGDLIVRLTEPTASFELSIVEISASITCADGALVSTQGVAMDDVVCLADMTGVRIIGDTYDNAYSGQSLTASLDGAPAVGLRFDGEDYKGCDCNATPIDVSFSFPMCACDGDDACTESPAVDQSCGQDIGATCCDNNERLECGECANSCAWVPAC
ncbi:MAG: hypothetical protein AAF721_30210 [Myxococcota bacterium]